MGSIAEKLKKKVTSTKNKVLGTAKKVTSTTKDNVVSSNSGKGSQSGREYKKGMDDTRTDRTRDSTREYEEKEPMSPAKLNQHEPTAVRREPSDQKIIEPGKKSISGSPDAKEKARRSGMAKGTT